MKKIWILFMIVCVFIQMPAAALSLSAKSAVLMEAETGRILYEKNANTRMPMASTTKIMTALLALESGDINARVTVSQNAASQEGSSMYLKSGETLSLGQLVEGLMLASGNDAAVAIAEHLAGSVDAFAEKMTARAKTMGCQNTHFKNPNGLPDAEHFTTATELAEITRQALRNEEFCRIVSQKTANVGGRVLSNHNKLLSMYEGAIGVKTGFTKASGRTLVSAAERAGVRLVAVTLSAPDDWNDHIKMLDEGFSKVEKKTILQKGDWAGEISVLDAEKEKINTKYESDFAWPVLETDTTEIKMQVKKEVNAPVLQEENVGVAEVFINGEKAGEVDILASESAEKKPVPTFWDRLWFVVEMWAYLL